MTSRSTRGLALRLKRMTDRQSEVLAWVGAPDGTVSVSDTSNQVYIRLYNDINQTHPAFSNPDATGVTPTLDMVVVVRLMRGDYHIVREYSLTP